MPNGAVEVATAIAAVFDRLGLTYAMGRALALGAHGVPRMTFDVDINVGLASDAFLSDELADTLFRECGLAFEHAIAEVRRQANDSGFVRGNVGPVKVDFFFPAVVAMKTVFGRTKDFADIESLARYGGEPIDREFVARHVREILHSEDAERRLATLKTLLG